MKCEGPPSEPDIRVAEVVAALESCGCRPQRQGDGSWRARCPAHGGKNNNSLSVCEKDGCLLTHCHAQGCEHHEVLSALGFDRPNPPREGAPAEHAYRTADGSVLVTVMREDRPDGKRIWRRPRCIKKPPQGYPLLNLPGLVAAPGQPLLVVEGEKPLSTRTISSAIGTRRPHQSAVQARPTRPIGHQPKAARL